MAEGKTAMSRMNKTTKKIIALAYFHRYGWIAAMIIFVALWPEHMPLVFCVSFLGFSIWTFIGYRYRWRHIYCSFQNAYKRKMTPHSINWSQIKKSDVYMIVGGFFGFGVAMLILMILY